MWAGGGAVVCASLLHSQCEATKERRSMAASDWTQSFAFVRANGRCHAHLPLGDCGGDRPLRISHRSFDHRQQGWRLANDCLRPPYPVAPDPLLTHYSLSRPQQGRLVWCCKWTRSMWSNARASVGDAQPDLVPSKRQPSQRWTIGAPANAALWPAVTGGRDEQAARGAEDCS